MEYCLVEFEPYGYTYVHIKDSCYLFYSYATNRRMYTNASFGKNYWLPCNNTQSGYVRDNDVETPTFYFNSPFAIRASSDEKYYLLEYSLDNIEAYIPAVKRDGEFINIYTNKVLDVENGEILTPQPYVQTIRFWDNIIWHAL